MKKVLSVLLAGGMALSLTACGSNGEKTTINETSSSASADSQVEKIDKSQELVIYTNSGSDGRDEWLVEKAAEAGYKVQVMPLPASDLTNRLIAEKNNAVADVIIGLNNIEYEKLKAEDILMSWEPDWVDGVDDSLIDKDGYYYPISTTPLLLIYNNEMDNPPKDWTDLVKPEYKGLYQLRKLGGGTPNTIFASIISRYQDPDGDLGISDEGWKFAKKYFGNSHLIADGEDAIGSVIDGSLPMSMHWASGVIAEQRERDYEFGIMTPDVGEPFVVESTAIVKTTKHPELAVDFLNWFGSSEIQLAWSDAWGTIPAQEDAIEKVDDDIQEMVKKLEPQKLDWEFIAENIDDWVEKAELEYVQ